MILGKITNKQKKSEKLLASLDIFFWENSTNFKLSPFSCRCILLQVWLSWIKLGEAEQYGLLGSQQGECVYSTYQQCLMLHVPR